jgi:hypothetical protein
LWFSNRDGLKSVAQTGQTQNDAYAMFFDRDAWERFRLTKDEFALVKEADEKIAKTKGGFSKVESGFRAREKKDLVLDLEGLDARKARLTIASSALGDALVSKDGEMLYYLARFERGLNLWSTNLRTKETKMILTLNANSGNMAWDKDQKNIFLLSDGQISRIDPVPATPKRDMVAMSGEEALDVDAERAAMFDHVWRRTRDTFYSKGYHGIDWVGLRPVYAKYLPYIGNNFEFSEMLAEMLGELNISHSGATLSQSTPNDDATASLGVFFDMTYTGPGAKVAEVIKDGPLDRHNIDIKPGAIIEAVDGNAITPDKDIAQFLNRKVGKNVLISVADGATKNEYVVKPVAIGEENRLLVRALGQTQRRRSRQGEQRTTRLRAHSGNERRRVSHDVRGHHGQVRDAEGRRRRHALQRRRRSRRGPGDVLEWKKFFDYTTDTRSTGYEPNFRGRSRPSRSRGRRTIRTDIASRTRIRIRRSGLSLECPRLGRARSPVGRAAGRDSLGRAWCWREGRGDRQVFRESADGPDIKVPNQYGVVAKGKINSSRRRLRR